MLSRDSAEQLENFQLFPSFVGVLVLESDITYSSFGSHELPSPSFSIPKLKINHKRKGSCAASFLMS